MKQENAKSYFLAVYTFFVQLSSVYVHVFNGYKRNVYIRMMEI